MHLCRAIAFGTNMINYGTIYCRIQAITEQLNADAVPCY